MESSRILFYLTICALMGELSVFVLSLPAGLVFRMEEHVDEIQARSLISFPEYSDSSSRNSSPCSIKGSRFRLEKKSGKCFEILSPGPCGESMLFYPAEKQGDVYGECGCQRRDEDNPVPLVYHRGTNRCYPLYQQAYCKSHEWLVYSETTLPKCVTNPCRDSRIENPVLFKGKCVELFGKHPSCGDLFPIVGFGLDDFELICTYENQDRVLVPKGNCTCRSGFKCVRGSCRKVSSN